MGRNRKVGLDWWPRDIGLYRDPKLRARTAENSGGARAVRATNACSTLPTATRATTSPTAARAARMRCGSSASTPPDWENVTIEAGRLAVVDQLAASGLFHAALYERGFLTSKRIQMGYLLATVTRNAVPINFDIWLLTEQEMREKNPSGKSFVLRAFISRTENAIYRTEACDLLYRKSTEQRRAENRRAEDSRGQ